MPKPEVKTEVKYILGEKKECEDKGGEFDIRRNFENFNESEGRFEEMTHSLICTKYYEEGNKYITETIFDYKI